MIFHSKLLVYQRVTCHRYGSKWFTHIGWCKTWDSESWIRFGGSRNHLRRSRERSPGFSADEKKTLGTDTEGIWSSIVFIDKLSKRSIEKVNLWISQVNVWHLAHLFSEKNEKLGRVAGPEALQCLWRAQCGDGDDELQVLRLEAVF